MNEIAWNKFGSQEEWMNAIIDKVLNLIETENGALVIGLAGGNTPMPVYEALGRLDLPWERLHFIIVDERYVPSTDEMSNLGRIKALMPMAKVRGFNTDLEIEEAISEMHRMLYGLDFDLLIMGMGKDGHVASLFPGGAALESMDLATVSYTEDFDVQERLTLTFEALKHASEALLLITGEEKAKVLEAALEDDDLPISIFLNLVQTEVYIY